MTIRIRHPAFPKVMARPSSVKLEMQPVTHPALWRSRQLPAIGEMGLFHGFNRAAHGCPSEYTLASQSPAAAAAKPAVFIQFRIIPFFHEAAPNRAGASDDHRDPRPKMANHRNAPNEREAQTPVSSSEFSGTWRRWPRQRWARLKMVANTLVKPVI